MTEDLSKQPQVQNGTAEESGESQNESVQSPAGPEISATEGDPPDTEQADAASEDEGYDDTDYVPDFIQERLENPPILPGEDKDAFGELFESFEYNYKQRPKTDLEYFWTFQATIAAWELMRYERMKVAIVTNERRSAAESLHRRCATEASTHEERNDIRKSARKGGMMFFIDPDYRKKFTEKLERAGFSTNAVDATAFLQALGSLAAIDRLIKSAEKTLADCLKKLDAAYAGRDPEQPMRRSLAAMRAEEQSQEQAEAVRRERAAKMSAK